MWILGSTGIFAVPALAQLLEVTAMGESAVPNAGLHPHVTRLTVIVGRIAFAFYVIPFLVFGIAALWR